jgi:hypothetical protein
MNREPLFVEGKMVPPDDLDEADEYGDEIQPPQTPVKKKNGGATTKTVAPAPTKKRFTLPQVHSVYRRWFGDGCDLTPLDAVCATAASERLDGDPLWLLLIAGPGSLKTETAQTLAGAGAHVISTISSEGALLSGTPQKNRAKTATGGLLRKIGARGVLVIKDVGTILSMARETRSGVLAALREIHDGRWTRNVGTDGGRTLEWIGRIVIIGAATTAWDAAHAVVTSLGDRFVLVRMKVSKDGRKQSGMRAISNTGDEAQMRAELAEAVGGLVTHASTEVVTLTDDESLRLVKAADIVTVARTAVERDYRGDVIDAHAPEMPTRFVKQLVQMMRGGVAIGMEREEAMRLAIRCARDSIPPLRLEILLDVAANPSSRPGDVRKRINKPWSTVKREMEALHMLGILRCDESAGVDDDGAPSGKTIWHYDLGFDFDQATLLDMTKGK